LFIEEQDTGGNTFKNPQIKMKDKAEFLPNSAWYLRLENQ